MAMPIETPSPAAGTTGQGKKKCTTDHSKDSTGITSHKSCSPRGVRRAAPAKLRPCRAAGTDAMSSNNVLLGVSEVARNGGSNDLLNAALEYAASGWPVLPLHSPMDSHRCSCGKPSCTSIGKHPRTEHGVLGATTDEPTIRSWWQAWPDANIGLTCGNGRVVVDVDDSRALEEFEAQYGTLPVTPRQQTGKGLHLVFSSNGAPIGNKVRFAPCMDLRADGGYIVAAPSRHANGAVYTWVVGLGYDEIEPAPLPEAIVSLLAAADKADHEPLDPIAVLAGVSEGARNQASLPVCLPPAGVQQADRPRGPVLGARGRACLQAADGELRSRSDPPISLEVPRGRCRRKSACVAPPHPVRHAHAPSTVPARCPPSTAARDGARDRGHPPGADRSRCGAGPRRGLSRCSTFLPRPRWQHPHRTPEHLRRCRAPFRGEEERGVQGGDTAARGVRRARDPGKTAHYQQAQGARTREEATLKKLRDDAVKSNDPDKAMELGEDAEQLAETLTEVPATPQLLAADATPEALTSLLAEQGGTIAALAPEGGGVFDVLGGRYSQDKKPNFDVYLSGYDEEPIRVNRQGRVVRFPQPRITAVLTVQPDVIRGLAVHKEFEGRGFLGRWAYILPASLVGHRENTNRPSSGGCARTLPHRGRRHPVAASPSRGRG